MTHTAALCRREAKENAMSELTDEQLGELERLAKSAIEAGQLGLFG